MAQLSPLEQLDEEQLAALNVFCHDKKLKLEDITTLLQGMGIETSRSAVGRYRKNVRDAGRYMLESRKAVTELKSEMGDMADDEQSQLNYEMLQAHLFRAQMRMASGEYDEAEMVGDLRKLSDAYHRLAAGRKIDIDRVAKIEAAAAKKAAEKVIDGVQAELKKNKQPGLSKEAVSNIWQAAGIPKPGGAPAAS